jgi:hypothetical protein
MLIGLLVFDFVFAGPFFFRRKLGAAFVRPSPSIEPGAPSLDRPERAEHRGSVCRISDNQMMSSTGTLDGRAEITCGVEGCNGKIKTTMGALRGGTTLCCSAGHKTIIDGRRFDKQLRDFERTKRTFK